MPGAEALKRAAAREAAGGNAGVIATSTPAINTSAAAAAASASSNAANFGGANDEGGVPSGAGPDEGEPIGPSAADEADMRDSGMTVTRYAPPGAATEGGGALPTLDSLIGKIPKETRTALDEQLRARFVRVKRLKPGELR